MGTLSSELGRTSVDVAGRPRIYADANMPSGVVAFMRATLGWDVLFVLEHDDLRRAPDVEHYRLARQLGRTLVTLDRDYLDDRRFPPAEGAGVIVFSAPDERWLRTLIRDVDRRVFRAEGAGALPLEGASSSGTSATARDRHRARPPRARIILSGASVVLPDRILHPGTVVIEDGRIASVEPAQPPIRL